MIMKYLVLAAIVAIVWYGFKAISRRNKLQNAEDQRKSKDPVEDMTACGVCGTFVTPKQGNCGKDGCRY
jgi:hypothetical protein